MNFIPEPRQRNDIAPFGFLPFDCPVMFPFFGKSFGIGFLSPKEVMRAIHLLVFSELDVEIRYHPGNYACHPQRVFSECDAKILITKPS